MRIRYCIISALTISLIASAPLNASAEALNDSFCSAEEIDEDIDNVNTYDEDLNDDFISNGSVENTEVFSSQMEAYSTEEDDSTTDGWTPLKKEPKISFKYDSETQTLSFKASEPCALPDTVSNGTRSDWYKLNKEVGNASTVIIGDNITKIGNLNFDNRKSSYPNLKNVVLAPSVKMIGRSAFYELSALETINLESVTSIDQASFAESGLKALNFNQSDVSIGVNAFADCESLETVNVKGLTYIGESAFESCSKLTSFTCDSTIPQLSSAVFKGCSSLNQINLKAVKIEDYAFINCAALSHFDFSETENIGAYAFAYTPIKKANFTLLKTIGEDAFLECSNFTSICYHGSKTEWDAIASGSSYPEEATIHYKEDSVDATPATCTEPGWKEVGVCDICGQHYSYQNDTENVIPALGHSYSDEYTVDKPATCTEEGEKSKHCENPGCEERNDVQKIDALGHDYVETTVAPTCTEKGTLTKTCSRCNDVVTEEIPALGHDFAKDYTVDLKATCTTDGKQSKHCSRCDEKTDEQKIPAFGHDFTSKVTKEATCTADGVITKTCSRCDVTETEAIKATGHKFGDWKIAAEATVFAPEQQERICETCGEKETKTVGTALKATATVNASSVKLKVKQSTSGLKITGFAKGDSVKTWKSTNTKIFTVKGKENGTCKIKAKKAGTAKLQITLASGLKKTVTVKVQKTAVKTTKVTVANTKVTVKKGKKVTLKPVVTPFTSKQKVTYTTSNKKIVTVSKNGVVTGKKKGTAKVTVKSGNKSVKVTVKVK